MSNQGERAPGVQTQEIENGRNVRVRSFYFRHAEKASGAVGSAGAISTSSISERGREESVILGEQLPEPARDGYKIARSKSPRALETADALAKGYSDEGTDYKTRTKVELWPDDSDPKFVGPYLEKWEALKREIMAEKGIAPEDFGKLPPREQALIAEAAEEPVISEWLNNPESEMAKAYPPEEAAARLAVLVNRDVKMPERLKPDSEIDLFRITHKTGTEPLLMRIIKLEDGSKPKTLDQIGGSLGLNDGWELDVATDDGGNKNAKLTLYRVDRSGEDPKFVTKEFTIDLEELSRLAEKGIAKKYGDPNS